MKALIIQIAVSEIILHSAVFFYGSACLFPRHVFIIALRSDGAMALAKLQENAVELPVADSTVAPTNAVLQQLGAKYGFSDIKNGNGRVSDTSRTRQLP